MLSGKLRRQSAYLGEGVAILPQSEVMIDDNINLMNKKNTGDNGIAIERAFYQIDKTICMVLVILMYCPEALIFVGMNGHFVIAHTFQNP